jgi:hypothetical protein
MGIFMARKSRQKKFKKNIVQPTSNEETIAKIDSLAKKAKVAKQKDVLISGNQNQKYIAIFAIVIIFGGFVGYFALFGGGGSTNISSGGITTTQVNYLVCEHSDSGDHYHFNVEIYIDGVISNLPSDIGATTCLRPIHTHEGELNKVHVELPSTIRAHPTVSDFFTVYKDSYPSASISNNELMGVKGNVTATVNGVDLDNFLLFVPENLDIVRLFVVSNSS